ncbi:hypothetical protein GIB67_021009 [Kingdonia uniflora]|uniref:Glycosyltransferase n=1 Tax=Kingdonia uniflora TaxID=39325 RepID=A0A7J7N758_9MAGN|nr:hypothetical protein GIB67_021009 [Kingdonia uniflora]
MTKISNKKPHVAVLAFPFGTHAAPLLHLVRKLASLDDLVIFSFFSTAKSNASIFGHVRVADNNIRVYDIEDGVPEGYVFTGKHQEDIELFIKATPTNFKKGFEVAVEESGGRSINCILSDAFLWEVADVAEEMGVSWVPFWTAGASSISTHFYTDLIRKKVEAGGQNGYNKEEEPLDFIPGMSSLCIRDLQEGIVKGNLDSLFSRLLLQMGKMVPRATAVVLNSFEELDPLILDDLKEKFQQCLTVGPLNLTSPSAPDTGDNSCIKWLDDQKPASVAYISFGTVMAPPPHELTALAQGLEASGVPFLWSIKDKLKVHLPDGFLARTKESGMVVPWVPQSQVLGHKSVGVFMTHGGWNSVLESITGGVPMICRPFFGDQRLNAGFVSSVWEIGIRATDGTLTKDGVTGDLDRMLSRKEGHFMREKVEALNEQANQAVSTEGSSTRNFNVLLELVTKI